MRASVGPDKSASRLESHDLSSFEDRRRNRRFSVPACSIRSRYPWKVASSARRTGEELRVRSGVLFEGQQITGDKAIRANIGFSEQLRTFLPELIFWQLRFGQRLQ